MPSNFDCIGLPGDSTEVIASLIEQILPASTHLGTAHSGAETYRWQDPSGARVAIEMRGKLVHNAMPSFAGVPATQLRDAHRRTNALTGTDFVTASVATAGFSVDVCMRPSDIADLPQAGQVVAATVYMVGSLDEWVVQASPPERSGWRGLLGRARKPAAG